MTPMYFSNLTPEQCEFISQRDMYFKDRIAAMKDIESSFSSVPRPADYMKGNLIKLVHPSCVTELLKLIDKYSDTSESTDSTRYFEQLELQDALDRMVRTMSKIDDNGEAYFTNRTFAFDAFFMNSLEVIVNDLEEILRTERMEACFELEKVGGIPKCAMRDVQWSFYEEKSLCRKRFDDEVFRSRLEIYLTGSWDTERAAILAPKIRIANPIESHRSELAFELNSDNGKWFTHGELLFKLHNLMADFSLGDHIYFEGLDLDEHNEGAPPLYSLFLGS
ncbi:hypothetical protein [Undibacterium aquatile]|uniref:Uncharacterized protein n=1 Tax=Undibacterium aquatile TaxID=1537398 RepID=A0ABR6XAY9_9BURK|nr:hypothetical protein [Undibacterium aquatile]MBC3810099.1 hypothetical protein [Undibacterium aquatile]